MFCNIYLNSHHFELIYKSKKRVHFVRLGSHLIIHNIYNKIDNILTYEQYILVKQLGYSENSSAIKKIKTKKEKFIIKDAIESFKRAEEYYENEQRKNTTRPSHAAALD